MEIGLLFAFSAFLLTNLALGLYQGRNVRTLSNYILADRSLSTGTLVLTLAATVVGAEYMTTLFRSSMLTIILNVISVFLGALIVGFYVYPKLQEFKKCYTLGDIVGQVYGKYAQVSIGLLSAFVSVIFLSGQLVAVYRIKSVLGMGTDYGLIILIGIVVIMYTVTGGIRAVASTDVLQFTLVIGSISFIAYQMLNIKVGSDQIQGFADLYQRCLIQTEEPSAYGIISAGSGVFRRLHLLPSFPLVLLSPAIINRVLMARDKVQVKNSFIGFSILYPFLVFMIFISGLGLVIFHGHKIKDNQIFESIVQAIASGSGKTWVKGLLMLMLLAAVMSSADSMINSGVAVVIRDIILPYQGKPIKHEMHLIKLIALLLGSSGIVLALLFLSTVPLNFIVLARSLLGIYIIPILGIVIGVKKSQKALLWAIGCFILLFLGSIVLSQVMDLSFIDPTNWSKITVRGKYKFFLPYVILLSVLAYLLFESITNQGLKWEERLKFTERESGFLTRCWGELKSFVHNPLQWSEDKIDQHGSRPALLALFCVCIFLIPSFVGIPLPQVYTGYMTSLTLSVLGLCSLLLLHDQWYRLPQRYYSLFYLFSLAYCIPFAFLLRWLYHPSMLTGTYLSFVPIIMCALVGRHLSVASSLIGYVLAFGAWGLTVDPGLEFPESNRLFTMLVVLFATMLAWVFSSYHSQLSWNKFMRNKMWTVSWGHDLNHFFMETQMEVHEELNPLPKEEKARLQECEKRLKSISTKLEAGIAQSQAFRQLMVQDGIRASEIESLPLAKVVDHAYHTLIRDFQDMMVITGKAPIRVRVFLPIFANVLGNLIRNAYYHGNASKVELAWDEKAPILYVKDNGVGIPKEKLANLFEFKPGREGTGIGLPFIKNALTLMHAFIDVETSDKGTTFMILLDTEWVED